MICNPTKWFMLIVLLFTSPMRAELSAADCDKAVVVGDERGLRLPLALSRIAEANNFSVVAEIKSGVAAAPVLLGSFSVAMFLRSIDPDLKCEANGSVLHIFHSSVVEDPTNALNYKFIAFETPSQLAYFKRMMQARLRGEPWDKSEGPKIIQDGGSGPIPPKLDKQIKVQVFRQKTAREILLAVAQEQQLTSVLQIEEPIKGTPEKESWARSDASWYWKY